MSMEPMGRKLHSGLFQEIDRVNEMDQGENIEFSTEFHLGSLSFIKKMESRLESIEEHLSPPIREIEPRMLQRLEKLNQRIKLLEKKLDQMTEGFQSKWRHLMGKVTEKTITDGRIQALFDRHNHLVHQFENRLNQMQRVINEQKVQLMNSRDDLSCARREIEKLKRL